MHEIELTVVTTYSRLTPRDTFKSNAQWVCLILSVIVMAGCAGVARSQTLPTATRTVISIAPTATATATATLPTSTPVPTRTPTPMLIPPTATLDSWIGQHPYSTTLQVVTTSGVTSPTQVNYLLYLPRDYGKDPRKQWPLILFLHGMGQRGNDPDLVAKAGLPMELQNALDFPFIVLSPQSPPDQSWDSQTGELNELLNEIQTSFYVDPKRVYLTGLSMGGFGVWAMALQYPARFAAVVPIAGGYEFTDETVPHNICNLKRVPIWVFHGAQDVNVPPDQTIAMVNALQACQANVKFTLYPDANHDDSWTRAYANPELYDWLMQQRLK